VAHGAAPDDHGGGGGVDPAAVAAGHEPDVFAVAPIMGIPLAVVIAFVVAFTVAAGAFAYFAGVARQPDNATVSGRFSHPEAVARGEQGTNERLSRIEREGLRPHENPDVDQPRLEPLRKLEGDGMFYARPPLPTGNSPEIHWEDIRPDRVAGLHEAKYVGQDKKVARIPIGEAMKLAAADRSILPVAKNASKPVGTGERPSASNGGQNGGLPPLPKVDEKEKGDKGGQPAGKSENNPKGGTPAPAPKPAESKTPEPPKK
jgi:hypothetical protein